MEAVKLSLRMRISIGSASSWINSHPIDSLSSDSLSSENDDSQPVSEKVSVGCRVIVDCIPNVFIFLLIARAKCTIK